MGNSYQLDPDHPIHFLTINVEHNFQLFYPDGPREANFLRQRCNCMKPQLYCDILISALDFYRKQRGLKVFGYVLMPTHVHGLFLPEEADDMDALIGDWRTWTAKRIVALLRTEGHHHLADRFRLPQPRPRRWQYHLWEFRAWDTNIRTKSEFEQKLRYIHENPI